VADTLTRLSGLAPEQALDASLPEALADALASEPPPGLGLAQLLWAVGCIADSSHESAQIWLAVDMREAVIAEEGLLELLLDWAGSMEVPDSGCPVSDCPACENKAMLASGHMAAGCLKLLSLVGAGLEGVQPGPYGFAEALVEAGAPGRIVQLLKREPAPAEEVAVDLACVLGNICLWDRGAVVEAGAVGVLAPWLVQEELPELRYTSAQVLCNVLGDDAGAARELVELGGVPSLLELLGCEEWQVRLWAATALWRLVQHGGACAAAVAAAGAEARLAERLAEEGERRVWELLGKCLMRLRACVYSIE
jgi:hypothetical protein